MHLVRNLNPALSRLYIGTGVIMLALGAVLGVLEFPTLERYRTLMIAVLGISGLGSIVSGAMHH